MNADAELMHARVIVPRRAPGAETYFCLFDGCLIVVNEAF
jgi:hypothetical protein